MDLSDGWYDTDEEDNAMAPPRRVHRDTDFVQEVMRGYSRTGYGDSFLRHIEDRRRSTKIHEGPKPPNF